MASVESGAQALTRRSSRSAAMTTFSMEVFDNEVVRPTLASIVPILRVSNDIEADRPRVDYLCRFYAFEKAHWLDQNSTGSSSLFSFNVWSGVRFHYGHPDVFDRIFHITRGISKASCGINLSEGIFAGFNSTLRRGNITHHEYIQVGKGRGVGLNQISLFEAKVACGNGEQTLSRDVYRLGHRFDMFRMLSCYFTTIGFYVSSVMVVLIVYVFLYGRPYLSFSGLEKAIMRFAHAKGNDALEAAMSSQSLVQLGLLMALYENWTRKRLPNCTE